MPTDSNEDTLYYDQRSVALRTTQSIYFVQEHDKMAMLDLLLEEHKKKQIVIVTKSKKKADNLSELLNQKGLKTKAVHGNHRESQQQESAKDFNLKNITILITTDKILQTLVLENIALILSHDLPEMAQDYYNRLALMKELGLGIALVSLQDEPLLLDIEYNMKAEIEEKTLESFVETAMPTAKNKKDRSRKPRHRKNKS